MVIFSVTFYPVSFYERQNYAHRKTDFSLCVCHFLASLTLRVFFFKVLGGAHLSALATRPAAHVTERCTRCTFSWSANLVTVHIHSLYPWEFILPIQSDKRVFGQACIITPGGEPGHYLILIKALTNLFMRLLPRGQGIPGSFSSP